MTQLTHRRIATVVVAPAAALAAWALARVTTLVRATEIRTTWGEPVLYAVRGAEPAATFQ